MPRVRRALREMRTVSALDACSRIVREAPTADLRIRDEVSVGNCNCDNWEATLERAASQLLFKGDYSILVQYCRRYRYLLIVVYRGGGQGRVYVDMDRNIGVKVGRFAESHNSLARYFMSKFE